MKIIYIAISFLFCVNISAQEKFDIAQLNNPNKYGEQIENSFEIKYVYEYHPEFSEKTINLKNGLRSSNYINSTDWSDLEEEVRVKKIKLVFSKYPIVDGQYKMKHPLLCNRLKNLFEIDPALNDTSIDWEIILHTNCKTDEQVDQLFHGVVIEYEKVIEEMSDDIEWTPTLEEELFTEESLAEKDTISNTRVEEVELISGIEAMMTFSDLPEDLLLELVNKNNDERKERLMEYFEELLEDKSRAEITSEFLEDQEKLVRQFLTIYSQGEHPEDVVTKVLDRNTQWKNALVVGDWTGSMYPYGGQALLWHTLNFKTSGLDYFALFNDGDAKRYGEKIIGETGGIYFEQADNIDRVMHLYRLVMLKGGGGDGPENDLEGILKAIKKYPYHQELILIADNNACVRDMELLDSIKEPVKVIVCGYSDLRGLNPQYYEIALKTGGSLHTMELDLYNLQVKLNKKKKLKTLAGQKIKISAVPPCANRRNAFTTEYYKNKIYKDLEEALKDKRKVVNLDLSNKGLSKIPKKIKKISRLRNLVLKNNKITKIPKHIYSSDWISNLDLSNNQISEIPAKLDDNRQLKRIDLSHNKIKSIDLSFSNLKGFRYLNLSNNEITSISKRLNARPLVYLYLDNNKLEELPSAISRLKYLEELTVSGNQLSELTRKISYLKRLKVLDLSYNQLTKLPTSLGRLKKLERLILTGNPMSIEYVKRIQEVLPNTVVEFQ